MGLSLSNHTFKILSLVVCAALPQSPSSCTHECWSTALSGSDLFLAANSKTVTHLSGRIIPQSGADLDNIGTLFSGFLAGQNQTLVAKGDSVQPSGSTEPVTWLSDAFKTLSLDVTLPGQKFNVSRMKVIEDCELNILHFKGDTIYHPE